MSGLDSVVVLDFETTGLSPRVGDRAIEIGAVLIEGGEVKDSFQALMNPGQRISSFIEGYTGITNEMLSCAPPCEQVMEQFSDFIGDCHLVAHNASFDKRFLDAEMARVSKNYSGKFACSMLLSRRIYPDACDHKLASLISYLNIEMDGQYHRALYDSQMTAKLWLTMLTDIKCKSHGDDLSFDQLIRLSKAPKNSIAKLLSSY